MNNYHITEIGRSKDSVVYKGRLKKTIEYLAIKSSEKENSSILIEFHLLPNNEMKETIAPLHFQQDKPQWLLV